MSIISWAKNEIREVKPYYFNGAFKGEDIEFSTGSSAHGILYDWICFHIDPFITYMDKQGCSTMSFATFDEILLKFTNSCLKDIKDEYNLFGTIGLSHIDVSYSILTKIAAVLESERLPKYKDYLIDITKDANSPDNSNLR